MNWTWFLAQHEPSSVMLWVDKLARAKLSHVLMLVGVLTVVHLIAANYMKNFAPHQRFGMYAVANLVREIADAIIYAGVLVFMVIRPFLLQTFFIPSPSMVKTLLVNDLIVANKAIYRYSQPQLGDIIVFKPPVEAMLGKVEEQDYIKRLVGRPGDIVEIRNGSLYRNGQKITEPYLNETMDPVNFKLVKYTGSYAPFKDKYLPVSMPISHPTWANYGTPTAPEYAVRAQKIIGRVDYDFPDSLKPDDFALMKELIDASPAAIPPGYYMMMGDNRNNSFDSRGWGLVPRDNIVGRAEFIWFPISRWRITR